LTEINRKRIILEHSLTIEDKKDIKAYVVYMAKENLPHTPQIINQFIQRLIINKRGYYGHKRKKWLLQR
jgi:hypothetical protein